MPIARFQMPDGRIGRFEVPEGTTPEQAQEIISRFVGASGDRVVLAKSVEEPDYVKESRDIQSVTGAELAAANPMARVAVGAVSPILGAMEQFGLRTPEQREQLKAMQERGNRALGFGAAGVVGDIAGEMLSPVWLKAAKAVPAAGGISESMAQGAGLGALGGLTAQTDSPLTAAVAGGIFGGAVPLALAGAGKVGGAIANLSPQRRKEDFYRAAAGDKADEIIDLLRRNEQIVPGSAPTAGQAAAPAGRAEFSAIQAAAARGAPSAYAARTDEQSAAQLAKLRSVGKDTTALEAAIDARTAAADPLYKAARTGGPVDVRPVVTQLNKLLSDNPGNTELVNELVKIKRGLLMKGGVRDDPQQVSSVIDGIKTAIADEKNKFIAGKLDEIKTAIEKSLPGYEKAQNVFRDMSAPVNQMKAGQYLEELATPTGYQIGAGTPLRQQQFLEAIRKSTDVSGDEAAKRAADLFARRTTGNPRFRELTDILNPQQMSAVSDVAADFLRNRQYIEQAVKGASNLPQFKETAKLPNLLMREAMVMNAIIGKAEGKINERLAAEIAVEMLNPPAVAEAMSRAVRRQNMNSAKAATLAAWAKTLTPAATQTVATEAE